MTIRLFGRTTQLWQKSGDVRREPYPLFPQSLQVE